MQSDSTERFSNRVNDYVKYRPNYPAEIVTYLEDNFQLTTKKRIADIGAGTGISTALFLQAGYRVVAVEPNAAMRSRSIELLGKETGFTAVDGTAEQTTLQTGSIDAIIAGQAFHWFEAVAAKREFKRILQPGGIVVLIWNERLVKTAFEKAYDQLIIQHGKDYRKIDHRNTGLDKIEQFFEPATVTVKIFFNKQVFGFEGLEGRLLSSSYMPVKTDPGYQGMLHDLQYLFDRYNQNGQVTINYETRVYTGNL